MRIIKGSAKTLKEKALLVTKFDEELEQFVEQMHQIMVSSNGIGLAANQVDDLRRIITIKIEDKITLINPEIISAEGENSIEEGCLSYPGVFVRVNRAEKIKIKAQDIKGEHFELEADGLLSICIQHEIDHLNGITFLSYLSRQQRRALERKVDKESK